MIIIIINDNNNFEAIVKPLIQMLSYYIWIMKYKCTSKLPILQSNLNSSFFIRTYDYIFFTKIFCRKGSSAFKVFFVQFQFNSQVPKFRNIYTTFGYIIYHINHIFQKSYSYSKIIFLDIIDLNRDARTGNIKI